MALPRPLLFALVGAILLGAAFFATQVMAGAEGDGPAPAAVAPASPGAPGPGAGAAKPDGSPVKPAAAKPKPGGISGKAVPVSRWIARGRTVVVLFAQSGAADDAETKKAVRALRSGGSKVKVVVDDVENVADYGPIAASLGISQAPSVVIADGKRSARVLEGYLDAGTLRQSVRDATR